MTWVDCACDSVSREVIKLGWFRPGDKAGTMDRRIVSTKCISLGPLISMLQRRHQELFNGTPQPAWEASGSVASWIFPAPRLEYERRRQGIFTRISEDQSNEEDQI